MLAVLVKLKGQILLHLHTKNNNLKPSSSLSLLHVKLPQHSSSLPPLHSSSTLQPASSPPSFPPSSPALPSNSSTQPHLHPPKPARYLSPPLHLSLLCSSLCSATAQHYFSSQHNTSPSIHHLKYSSKLPSGSLFPQLYGTSPPPLWFSLVSSHSKHQTSLHLFPSFTSTPPLLLSLQRTTSISPNQPITPPSFPKPSPTTPSHQQPTTTPPLLSFQQTQTTLLLLLLLFPLHCPVAHYKPTHSSPPYPATTSLHQTS